MRRRVTKSTKALLASCMIGAAMLLPFEVSEAEVDLVARLSKISQALRNGKTPDAALLVKAKADPKSVNIEEVVGQWIESEDFYANMRQWHRQIFRTPYLLKSDIEFLDRAPVGLRESLAEEPVEFAIFVLKNNLSYTTLLESRLAVRNSVLEKFYAGEDPTGASATDWKPVWRADFESGVLTLRSMHLRNPTTVVNRWRTHANQVLEQWACQHLKAANVQAKEDDAAHGTDPGCIGCHRPLDGIGTHFSRWDRSGHFDDATPLDDRGSFYETTSKTQQGSGLAGLGKNLASSQRYAHCMVDKTWSFLAGRAMTEQETTARTAFLYGFWQSGYNLKALIKSIVMSDEFGN